MFSMDKVFKSLRTVWMCHIFFQTVKLTASACSSSVTSALNQLFSKTSLVQVLFFPDRSVSCKKFLMQEECSDKACGYAHEETSLSRLIHCLLVAKDSIDVCVFTITSKNLADVLIMQHKQGLIVRIITDCEKMDLNCSQIEQFRAVGIQVRHDKTSYFMHHKFAIVDGKTLINGSFNWTNQAITGNQENVIIADLQELVNPYKEQFEVLWNQYKP